MQSSLWRAPNPLVLASGSSIRAQILQNLHVPLIISPSSIDERCIETLTPADTAPALARAKALDVSGKYADHLVLGADQTLIFEEALIHKPTSHEQARDQLQRLSGKTHQLKSSVCLVKNQHIQAEFSAIARITFRTLRPEFIETYLAAMGDAVFYTVGGYQLEALGPHIIEGIDGDHSTILGLPVWPLMQTLRTLGYFDA